MMATVEGRVPGGRQRSMNADEFCVDDDEDFASSSDGLSPKHKHVSQSLPRFGSVNDPRKVDNLPDNFDRSYTLDRKKISRSSRSFRSILKKMAKHVTSSVQSPQMRKRNPSETRVEVRSRKGTILSAFESISHSPNDKSTPTESLTFEDGKVPGVTGIRNHGNTCFMNAVVQCLNHTELLVEYFVTDHYKQDIKRNNKQNSKKYGTKGELTEHLAILLKSLWTCQYLSDISSNFKSVVGKYGAQYRGYSQHDAQEFLMWLLDKVHEDLNIAAKKKYKPNKGNIGRADEIVAAEALANHMRCNNSFVYDLFQALYRSSLTCPNCRRQSSTFDPFLSVSLPIPQKTRRPVYVTVAYLDAQPRQVRIGLLLNEQDCVRALREALASDTNITESQLLLTELYADGFHRTFSDGQPLAEVHETDNVYAIETPQPLGDATDPTESHLVNSYVTTVVVNQLGVGSHGRRFGGPLVLQVRRDTSFLDLQNDILHNMMGEGMVRDGIIAQKMGVLFRLRVADGLPGKCYLPHDVTQPLNLPTVDRALACCGNQAGPQHIKLIVEWDQQTKQCMIAQSDDVIEEHASLRQVQQADDQPMLATLDECFRLYTQEERLSGDDAWHCPNCRKRQQGTIKSISLWSLPDIMVIHLKRFKQDGLKRTKLNTLITFPVTGLDMDHHIAKRNNSHHGNHPLGSSNSLNKPAGWSPWRPNKPTNQGPETNIYDLYAVCNHYGNMQGGHYTAFCKNTADARWYTFDDTKVTSMPEEEVVTRAAYLLFYQRRGATCRDLADPSHWIHRLASVHFKGQKVKTVSKSHEDLLDENTSPHNTTCPEHFTRSVHAYATMRSGTARHRANSSPPKPFSSHPQHQPHHNHSQTPLPAPGFASPPTASRGLTVGQLARQMDLQRRAASGGYATAATPTTPGSPVDSVYSEPLPTPIRSPLPRGHVVSRSNTIAQGPMLTNGFSPRLNGSSLGNVAATAKFTKVIRGETPVSVSSSSLSSAADVKPRETPKEVPKERVRAKITRSMTSPEVSSSPLSVGNTMIRKKEATDKELQRWDYNKTVFLQESCV